ncbi:MAG TPA: allantoate amidohydrolase [Acidobacteriaceae bacterium]
MSAGLRVAAERVLAQCRQLALITDVPGQTTRTFLSPATRQAQTLVAGWMEAAGLVVQTDAIGNLRALPRGVARSTPRLLIGSHLDTVRNAGAYDGVLGVLLAVALCALLAPGEVPFAIEVIAFSDEEGVRFGRPFLGSLALIGESVPGTVADSNGITLADAVARFGHQPTASATLDAAAFAYFEFHIEQGPLLEAEQRPLAAVSSIAGQTRQRLTFRGQANHAGTTPMHLRHDALAAAAQWMVELEARALADPGLMANVGSIEALPGVGNVVPGEVILSLDLRHPEDSARHAALDAITPAAHQAAARRGVSCSMETLLDQPAVLMDEALTAALVRAAGQCGYDARPLVSGAGHDAMILARRIPAAMLFLRTPAGLSHHPDEAVLAEDVEAALATGLALLRNLSPSQG